MRETDVLNSVCEYLRLSGVFFWRNNTVGIYDAANKGFRRPPKFSMKGVPDIIAVINGYFVGFEIKRPKHGSTQKTYQSQDQKLFEELVKKANGFYFVIRSTEDAQSALQEVSSKTREKKIHKEYFL